LSSRDLRALSWPVRIALRLAFWLPGPSKAAVAERFIANVIAVVASRSDPDEREAAVAVAELYESYVDLPVGTIRRRLQM
jgi:hypothetical protein